MKKAFLFIFFLFLIGGFLFSPKIGLAEEISIEDLIEGSEKIQLEEDEGEHILGSLIQELHNEWEAVVVEGGDKVREKEVVLLVVKKAVQKDLFDYLFLETPKEITTEIIKLGAKIVAVVWGGDPSTIAKETFEEIEDLTVEKAREYAINWLLQNQIKVTGGNLPVSYSSIKTELQHIITYKPLDINKGRVSINIYSSSVINDIPDPNRSFQWEGGIDKLPPFILEINGLVRKRDDGGYDWIEGPQMNYIFDQLVPEFNFKEVGLLDKWKAKIKKNLLAFDKLKGILEKIGQKGGEYGTDFWGGFKFILSDINPFQATVNPGKFFPEDYSEEDLAEVDKGDNSSEEKPEEVEEEEPVEKPEEDPDSENEESEEDSKERKSRQDVIDDILEKIDILNSKIDELESEKDDSVEDEKTDQEKEDEKEEKGEDDEVEEEEDEEDEDEDNRGGGGGGSSEPDYCDISDSDPLREKIVLNEIAWMGTESSSNDEWIELKNVSDETVNVGGWQIIDKAGQIQEVLSSKELQPGDFYLLERTDDSSVPDILTDHIYAGGLNNTDEALYLFDGSCQLQDKVKADSDWPGGGNENKKSMERGEDLNWHTFSGEGNGTPKAENSSPPEPDLEPVLEVSPQELSFESTSSTKIITVDTGGQELEWAATSLVDWLGIDTLSATSSQEVAVSVNCSGLSPGSYSADIIFSAEDLKERVEVELVIEPEIKPLDHVVISEIQLGDKEFVELYNPKDTEIDLSEWYFSYYSSSREEWNNPYRNKQLAASSTIPAKGYYLIGFEGYSDVLGNPASDWQVYSSSQLSDSKGSVAVFPWDPREKSSEEAKTGRIDAVGWGEVSVKEGESCDPAPGGKSLNRKANSQYQDTDFNSFDFEVGDLSPTNSKKEIYSLSPDEKFDWPMVQQNAQNTGRSKYPIPENLEEKWSLVLEDSISDRNIYGGCQPIIGKDGVVYYTLRESTGNHKGNLYAVNPDGTEKWVYEMEGDYLYTPSIGLDGTIYVPSYEGFIYALNLEGEEKWVFDTGQEKWISRITVGDYHNIYFTDYDYIYSVDSQGILNWKSAGVSRGGSASLGPALGEDGTVYISWTGFKNSQDARTGALYAYNPIDGSVKWHAPLDHDATSPVIGEEGNMYLVIGDPWAGHEFRILRSYDSEGNKLWENEKVMDGSIRIPKIGNRNKIIITDSWSESTGSWSWGSLIYQPFSKLIAYSLDGSMAWQSETEENLSYDNEIMIGSQNKILAERTLYEYWTGDMWDTNRYSPIGRRIYKVDLDGGVEEEIEISGEFLSSFAAGKEHIYLVVKDEGKIELKAFGEGPERIEGCTDPEAENYNPEAVVDDNSCEYKIEGCTNPEAPNYNPEATIDDGSCIILEVETESLDSASSSDPIFSPEPLSASSSSSTQSGSFSLISASSSVPFKKSGSSTSSISDDIESPTSSLELDIKSSSSTPDIILKEKTSNSTEKTSSSSFEVEDLNIEKGIILKENVSFTAPSTSEVESFLKGTEKGTSATSTSSK